MRRAFVLIKSNLGKEHELKTKLEGIEGIVGVYLVYGIYDIVVEVEAESEEKLKDIVVSAIRPLGQMESTLTLIAVPGPAESNDLRLRER